MAVNCAIGGAIAYVEAAKAFAAISQCCCHTLFKVVSTWGLLIKTESACKRPDASGRLP
ncbi:MAG: hypothetical protein AAF959_23380 [Cyanobacteria bacterium P01_D01_bin.56]